MKKPKLLLLGLCLALIGHSQSGLHISSATTFSIRTNTTVSVDGLVLTPSSNYIITGSTGVTRTTTLLHTSITPAIHRSFQWSAALPAFTGSIGIYYRDAELNGLAESELTLNVHNGTHWQAYASGVSRNATTNLVTTPVSGLQLLELSLAAEAQPLPLQWGRITASRKNQTALIDWQTHSEVQTAFFEVERSTDAQHWSRTGHAVPARNLPGTHSYQFTDTAAPSSKTFYRIKQVDLDEQASYSATAWIPALHQPVLVSLSPNPAGQQLVLRSGRAPLQSYTLLNTTGKQLRTEALTSATTHTIDIAWLPKGMYYVQVQLTDGSATTLSFIKN